MSYKKVIIKELENSFLEKNILDKINKNSGFGYFQEIGVGENFGVYRPFVVQISKKLEKELEKFLEKNIEVVFGESLTKKEKQEICKNNIFRIDGIIDKNTKEFNIVEINSHFPRLYMLNLRALKEYNLKNEIEIFKKNLEKTFLENGKYKKINIIYDENVHSIDYNLKCFLDFFPEIIDNVYKISDFENNFLEIKNNLKENPNIYRMIIKTKKFEEIIKKLDIKDLKIINSLEAGKIGEKENLAKINSDILPKGEKIVFGNLEENFIVPENYIFKTSSGAEGKGIFLPGEKLNNFSKRAVLLKQKFIEIDEKILQNGEKKFYDLNFFITGLKVVGAIIRLSNSKIVNVSAGGSFAPCILEIN